MCLSQLNKNKRIELTVELAQKYPSEQERLLIKYAKRMLYPDLYQLKMTFVDTIKSYIFEGHRIDAVLKYILYDLNKCLS